MTLQDTDQRQRFHFSDGGIRGEILRLDGTLSPILAARDYPMIVASLLAEAVAAAALLTGTLKFNGRLSLQAQGSGPITLLLAESTHDGGLRGLARWQDLPSGDTQPDLQALLGKGMLAITIRPEKGQQYQGLVPLESPTLAICLEDYFRQSEQLPTRLWLAAGNGRAAGMLLQKLPSAGNPDHHDHWETLTALADTLTNDELLGLPTETLLHRLFHQTPPRLSTAQSLHFTCTCSRKKVQQALISLGAKELSSLLEEQGKADVSCDFCGQSEVFDAVDLGELIHRAGN